MRFFFRRKPINPLEQAVQLLEAAMEIVWQHKWTKSYRPTGEDFETLAQLKWRLWNAENQLDYITRCLHQRAEGKPEGSLKWHNRE